MSAYVCHFLAAPESIRLGWALLHFLWEGLAITGLLEIALFGVSRRKASERHLLCGIALALMVLCFVATYLCEDGSSHPPRDFARGSVAGSLFSSSQGPNPFPQPYGGSFGLALPSLISFDPDYWMPWIVGLWLAGVAVLAARKAGGFVVVWRLQHRGLLTPADALLQRFAKLCTKLGIDACRVRLRVSALIQVPMALGWLKPVVLVPAALLSELSPEEIELLLAHELAHIRRCDYGINLLQTLVETVFFYHPAIWWISRRMRQERENACDDLVAKRPDEVLAYAKVLIRLETTRPTGSWLASAANGGNLLHRIQRLAGKPASRPDLGAPAFLTVIVLVMAVMTTLLARSAQAGSFPESSAQMTRTEAKQKGIAALVNGQPIYRSQVAKQNDGEVINIEGPLSHPHAHALQSLIDRALILQNFKGSGQTVPWDFVQLQVDDVLQKTYHGDQKLFEKELSDNGESLGQYKEEIAERLMVWIAKQRNIYKLTAQYYQDHLQLFPQDERVNISYLELKSSGPVLSTGGVIDAKERDPKGLLAEQIVEQARAGADFSELMKKYGEGGDTQGGPLWFSETSDTGWPGWMPLSWAVAKKMQPGQVTDVLVMPCVTPKGYCSFMIVRVNNHHAAPAPSTPALAQQRQALLDSEKQWLTRKWLDGLRSKAVIQKFDETKNDLSIYVPQAQGVDDPSQAAF